MSYVRSTAVLVLAAGLAYSGTGCMLLGKSPWPQHGGSGGGTDAAGGGQPSSVKSDAELPTSESASLLLKMAEGLERDGKDADAIAYYEKARQTDKGIADRAARRLAVLYDKMDQGQQSAAEFRGLLAKTPRDAELLTDYGYSLYNRGQWADAETQLKAAVEIDRGNKRAWVNLGLATAQQGRYEDAVSHFSKAVTAAEAEANVAFVLTTQGKKADAIGRYRKAVQLDPSLHSAAAALAKLERGPNAAS